MSVPGRHPRWAAACLLGWALLAGARPARAHAIDSALLSLTEEPDGRFQVFWHASSATLQRDLASAVVFPGRAGCRGTSWRARRRGWWGRSGFPGSRGR